MNKQRNICKQCALYTPAVKCHIYKQNAWSRTQNKAEKRLTEFDNTHTDTNFNRMCIGYWCNSTSDKMHACARSVSHTDMHTTHIRTQSGHGNQNNARYETIFLFCFVKMHEFPLLFRVYVRNVCDRLNRECVCQSVSSLIYRFFIRSCHVTQIERNQTKPPQANELKNV